jgi:glycosyltransferase involved in cell wall biosynthesis
MRVLLVDQFAELGGAQRGLLEAAEGFAERGWDVVAALPEGPLVDHLRPFCADIAVIPCGPFESVSKGVSDVGRFAAQFRRQARVIARMTSDVVYVNGPRVLAGAAWGRGTRPIVFHSHSVVTQRSAARFAGRILRWSDAQIIVSSKFVAGWLAPLVPPDRPVVIYNGIRDLNRVPRPRSQFTRIGVLGRIAPEKGQLAFVRAARITAEADPNLMFQVTGAPLFGSQSYVEQVHREAGPRVHFTEWTEDIGSFFDQIDVLVVPSESVDANPRVIPEAYAAGIPVIAFDSGGIAELLVHQETGILVREHSPEALAAAILQAVRDPAALNRYALNAHQRWHDHYTLARFQSEVCGVLERAVARHRAPASVSA